jgi:hypothetical protein
MNATVASICPIATLCALLLASVISVSNSVF